MTATIQPHALDELWFHTGTACNLRCPFCLEGSKPGDARLERITLEDVRPLVDEALALGVRRFSFTGGEPFVAAEFPEILAFAAERRPCLVLTNATDPLLRRLREVEGLRAAPNPVCFRVSLDYPEAERHDAGRGRGNFRKSIEGLHALRDAGFAVSLARQMDPGEDAGAVEAAYRELLRKNDLPADLRIVAFPDFGVPGEQRDVPAITEDCMTRYQTEETRRAFMCAFSKLAVKQGGRMRVFACTLVDDDPRYDLGPSLAGAMTRRIHLHHQRCYACFKFGSSCSEP
jgi:molybdenum cofactor biosynthesis enzyme MoaA